MKRHRPAPLTLALGTAIAASLAGTPAQAGDATFSAQINGVSVQVNSGSAAKPMEGRCGEGVCGAAMKGGTPGTAPASAETRGAKKPAEGRCGEGVCGAAMRGEGQAGASGKPVPGRGDTQRRHHRRGEGKAGEGKCGGTRAGEGSCGGRRGGGH